MLDVLSDQISYYFQQCKHFYVGFTNRLFCFECAIGFISYKPIEMKPRLGNPRSLNDSNPYNPIWLLHPLQFFISAVTNRGFWLFFFFFFIPLYTNWINKSVKVGFGDSSSQLSKVESNSLANNSHQSLQVLCQMIKNIWELILRSICIYDLNLFLIHSGEKNLNTVCLSVWQPLLVFFPWHTLKFQAELKTKMLLNQIAYTSVYSFGRGWRSDPEWLAHSL